MITDADLEYDLKRKRYRLNKDYVQNELGIDLNMVLYDEIDANPSTLADRTLKYTSNMVYDYMKRECADYKYACELIENDEDIHEAFKDCLYHQLVYFIQVGDLALSADGDMSKMISQRALQILLSYRLLTVQKKVTNRINIDYYFGGGIY